MSFYTGLTFYRPREPPAMTASELGQFIAQIRDAGLLANDGFKYLQVRFGRSIDQDERGTSDLEEETAPGLYIMKDIEWDLELSGPSDIAEIIAALANDKRRIYRATASLGTPMDAVLQPITRTNSPENTIDFCPYSLDIEIGPVMIGSLGCEALAFAGWIGVSLSGSGYLFPWTFRDVVKRLEGAPEIQRMTDVCRSFWPVSPGPPEDRIVDMRTQIGELWPYEDLDKPWDWYWGLQESG